MAYPLARKFILGTQMNADFLDWNSENPTVKIDGFVKSRHSRVGGNPGPTKPIEKTGFPFPRE
jgi:hypothetical protein